MYQRTSFKSGIYVGPQTYSARRKLHLISLALLSENVEIPEICMISADNKFIPIQVASGAIYSPY
jgi:hypothetical protein